MAQLEKCFPWKHEGLKSAPRSLIKSETSLVLGILVLGGTNKRVPGAPWLDSLVYSPMRDPASVTNQVGGWPQKDDNRG